MTLDNLDKDELVIVTIEQVNDIEKWKPFLLEISSTPISEPGYHMFATVNEERGVAEGDFMSEHGHNTIEIICSVREFIEIVPRLRELDDDYENEMLSVRRTYQELEYFYYDYGDEE
ncbi:MAG: hypothetical protein ACREV6_19395 [Clostridium sp.]|uniref:hypothetical protein n=1 Tax=Clostridium sp. TaxID=1506 RepID=UPI003D6D4D2B